MDRLRRHQVEDAAVDAVFKLSAVLIPSKVDNFIGIATILAKVNEEETVSEAELREALAASVKNYRLVQHTENGQEFYSRF